MRKTILLAATALFISSCNSDNSTNKNEENLLQEENSSEESVASEALTSFDITSIPYSDADLGEFPFINLPTGLQEMNKPLVRNFDICFFPVNGVMNGLEGKLYKSNVNAVRGESFSQRYFEKSMEDYLNSVGAVKVFDGEISREEYDRYHKQNPNIGNEGDIGYFGERIVFYAIRSREKGNIYIQYVADNASGKLNVLQEEAFVQTITKVTASEIAKDLSETGKSILYINFDVDKASLKSDASDIVIQIAEALKQDSSLKITIEGHTDNTGNAAHNKNLSTERANAVMSALIKEQIDPSRLSAAGFGAERPLVANDSEENKAKNRRVELIKMN